MLGHRLRRRLNIRQTLHGERLVFAGCPCGERCITCYSRVRILEQVTIYRRLLIGRDDHLDQSEAYDIS